MKNDFVIIQQRPTPDELLNAIIEIVPDFGVYWNQSDNYFRNDNGSFSIGGVFSELTGYIREHFANLKEAERVALFDLIEKCVKINHDPKRGVSNHLVSDAACTCFLENVAGEGSVSAAIAPYLGPCSREYFDKWN